MPEGDITRGKKRLSMKRVAFLVCRDHVIMCGDVISSARCWARKGWGVDVFSIDTGRFPPPSLSDEGVRFPMTRTLYARLFALGQKLKGATAANGAPGGEDQGRTSSRPSLRRFAVSAAATLLGSMQRLEFIVATTVRLLTGDCRLVIACDTPSLIAALLVRLLRGIPFVYHSRELLLSWDLRGFGERAEKMIERGCHRRAALTIIQDETRAGLLARDNGIPSESFVTVPNAPLGVYGGDPSPLLAEKLGLSPGTVIVLYAGTVAEETMLLEVVESVARWPDGTVLVIHGDINATYRPLLERAAAGLPGRVFFSAGTVQTQQLDRFFAGADVGLAFYRPLNDNFRYVGLAAGKVFNYMQVGCPSICNDLPGLKELLDDQGCGRTVDDPSRIGEALETLLGDREAYRRRCLETFGKYEFGLNYGAAIERMELVTKEIRKGKRYPAS